MNRRTTKTIYTLILTIVMLLAIFLIYMTHDKRFISDYTYETGGAFASTRELIVKPNENEVTKKVITDKDDNIIREAPYDRGAEYGLEAKDGPLELQDYEFTPDKDVKNLKLATVKMPVNEEDILTEENFKLSQKIIIDRLKRAGVNDFDITTNTETGSIVLRFSDINEKESEKLEKVKRVIETRGEFAVIDSKTGKEYLNNTHITKLTPYIHETGGVVIEFEFDKEGKKILSDITSKYVQRDRDLSEEELEELRKEAAENETELNITETAALYMTVDGEPISMGAFEEPINSGSLTIPLSKETNQLTEKEIDEALLEAEELASIIRGGVEPVRYEIFKETRLVSAIDKIDITILISIIAAISLGLLVLSIVLYRSNGLLAWYMSLVFLVVLFAIFKYTNIAFTIPSIIALVVIYIIQFILTLYVLKDVKEKNETNINKNIFLITKNTILLIIAGIILTFSKETDLSSFGQIICLGEIILIIFNYIFAKNILR